MASPLDILKKEIEPIKLPKKMNLAINLIQAFIKNNNQIGLKLAVLIAGSDVKIENNMTKFKVDELITLLKTDRRYLSNSLRKVIKVSFKYVDEQGNYGETTPIHSYEYSHDNKYLSIELSSKAVNLFRNLKTKKDEIGYQFTQILTNNFMNCDVRDYKSKHTLKMLLLIEMISNFKFAKRKKFDVEELNGYFGTEYKRAAELERKILRPVQDDLRLNSTISFEYQPYYDGKKIKGFAIDIIDNKNLFNL